MGLRLPRRPPRPLRRRVAAEVRVVRFELHLELGYAIDAGGADFVFNIHPAHTPRQQVWGERLSLSQAITPQIHTDPATGNRYMRLRAQPGTLHVAYSATVDLTHHRTDPALLAEVPVGQLPLSALHYIYPSRYCESDRLLRMAGQEFGGLPQGHSRVQAIMNWVQQKISYTSNTSVSTTSAIDTLVGRAGVCRDLAHLMIALCRAVNIPARFTTGTDHGADPALGPPDFHAYVEVFLAGGWYIFDASGTGIPMGFVRLGTGRDAADVAFATIFGGVTSLFAPTVRAVPVVDPQAGLALPLPDRWALSTDTSTGEA
jgi:transglutaminase-like putative cysteine protease